jgi:hypothetical protein
MAPMGERVKTFDVPDKIPLSKVQAFLADLGIESKYLRELNIGRDGVFVEIVALDDKGGVIVAPNGDIVMHRIALGLDRDA